MAKSMIAFSKKNTMLPSVTAANCVSICYLDTISNQPLPNLCSKEQDFKLNSLG